MSLCCHINLTISGRAFLLSLYSFQELHMMPGNVSCIPSVTKSGVRLLAAQKSLERPGWWKGKSVILEACTQGGGRPPVQRPTPPTLTINGPELLQAEGGVYMQKQHTVILKLVISDLISIILIALSTVSLQFQHWFISISLWPILRIVAAYIMATVWSSCS